MKLRASTALSVHLCRLWWLNATETTLICLWFPSLPFPYKNILYKSFFRQYFANPLVCLSADQMLLGCQSIYNQSKITVNLWGWQVINLHHVKLFKE